ncbi:MAG TPA: ankyrin repeat domain-containing protein [Pyrinomonadaceae bacterium]|nr:ankyrin repeat domain-containing protein [Pyrinomonadaceae bacterium]
MTTRAELSVAEGYRDGHTALMRAALDGNTEKVTELIQQGVDINQRDEDGRTALMFAVINSHYETTRVLLEYGADVNAKSNKGGTALMGAASEGDLRMVQALLDGGADVHARLRETNEGAATLAERHGHAEITRLLRQLD